MLTPYRALPETVASNHHFRRHSNIYRLQRGTRTCLFRGWPRRNRILFLYVDEQVSVRDRVWRGARYRCERRLLRDKRSRNVTSDGREGIWPLVGRRPSEFRHVRLTLVGCPDLYSCVNVAVLRVGCSDLRGDRFCLDGSFSRNAFEGAVE